MNLAQLLAYIGDRVRSGIVSYNTGLRVREAISQVAQEAKLASDQGGVFDNEGVVQFNNRVVDVYINTPPAVTFDFTDAVVGAAVMMHMSGDAPAWPSGSDVVGPQSPGSTYFVYHKGGGQVVAVPVNHAYKGRHDDSVALVTAHPAPGDDAIALVGDDQTGLEVWGWDGTQWASASSSVSLPPLATTQEAIDGSVQDQRMWSPERIHDAVAGYIAANPDEGKFQSVKTDLSAGSIPLPAVATDIVPVFYVDVTSGSNAIELPPTTHRNSYAFVAEVGFRISVADPDEIYVANQSQYGLSVQAGVGVSYLDVPQGCTLMLVADDQNNRYTSVFVSVAADTTLDGLSDVLVPTPQSRQVLAYNSVAGQWTAQYAESLPEVYLVSSGQVVPVAGILGVTSNVHIRGVLTTTEGEVVLQDMSLIPYYQKVVIENSHLSVSDLILSAANDFRTTGAGAIPKVVSSGANGPRVLISPGESVALVRIPTEPWSTLGFRTSFNVPEETILLREPGAGTGQPQAGTPAQAYEIIQGQILLPFVLPITAEDGEGVVSGDSLSFHLPFRFFCTEVMAGANSGPVGANAIFNLYANAVPMLSTSITVEDGETTSITAAVQPVISVADLAKGTKITVETAQVGSTAPGTGYKVYMTGYRVFV